MSIQPGFDFMEAAALLQICNKLYDQTRGMKTPQTPTCGVPAVPDPPANWVAEFKPGHAKSLFFAVRAPPTTRTDPPPVVDADIALAGGFRAFSQV
jgi:hypothetical protein